MLRIRHWSAVWLATVFLLGCDNGVGPIPPRQPRVEPEWVVGEAAAALDQGTGLFSLPDVLPRRVALPAAESLAIAAARLLGTPELSGNAATILESDRGGPIAFEQILPCYRRIYVHSPFTDFPPAVPSSLRRALAPQWSISLCGTGATAQLSIGVPDDTVDIILINGSLLFPPAGSGNDFSAVGIPFRYPWGMPLTPEEAVAHAVAVTGQPVALVPVAFNQRDDDGFGQLPLCASWRLVFAGPADFVDVQSGEHIPLSEIYVRRAPGCFSNDIAMYYAPGVQPTMQWLHVPSVNGTPDSVAVTVTGPLVFRAIAPAMP